MTSFVPGQRWSSAAEPELGLGTVLRLMGRSVQIVFTGSGEIRQYALTGAPLIRAEFRSGERVWVDGRERTVETVEERDGLFVYRIEGDEVHEGALDAEQPLALADRRLLAGQVDRNDRFEFRVEALEQRARAQADPGFGVLGARVDLIPHQLRIAELAAARRPVRLLLADEVGLGKTIEACLIAAQQLASGRARRVLVLTPDSLVNQWFVELVRRFNLAFAVFDAERCAALEAAAPGTNPFEDAQCVLASVDWLARDAARAEAATAAGWDLLLVDEAHHLAWSPDGASAGYRLVERLAAATPGVLLLTATPEQLGQAGHFARLRLLDPARYAELDAFVAEQAEWVALSALVERIVEGAAPDATQRALLARLLQQDAAAVDARLQTAAGDAAAREELLDALIDRHGTGRVMVRNRRAAVGGFPRRVAHLETLPAGDDGAAAARLREEFEADAGRRAETAADYARDPRTDWLLRTLEELAPAKVLVLCRTRARVQALEEMLRTRADLAVARFHDDMSLLQRDRNAAWFAEPDGARVLLASEVGAEGRNFQFAQHLLFWDLPLDPDVLEQRIGRLDRIGQRGDVHLHAAAVAGSPQACLLRWYHEALDAFTAPVADGRELARRYGHALVGQALDAGGDAFEALVADTRATHAELAEAIARGRDRLLELASQRGAEAGALLQAVADADAGSADDDYPLRLLEQFGVQHEPLGGAQWLLDPEYVTVDGLPELAAGKRQATFDRALALARDDLLFLRPDHPLVLAAQDLLLSGDGGNAAFLVDATLPPRSAVLEAVYVLECVAPRALAIERLLPPTPLRAAVDTRLAVRSEFAPSDVARLRAGDRDIDLSPYRKALTTLVPKMLDGAHAAVQEQVEACIAGALAVAQARYAAELERLRALARVNPAVHPDEIAALEAERDAVLAVLPNARPRLDALRLVVGGDFLTALRGR
ncbi:RNA polymerase-associated protein RapA [Coralloluteibacterium stylophorae]|uniref:RNA polymerase-associated protein RapA n=3 Tax=Coralloluteibacterium stylophorae TaxID=1776034 RepID=A0AAP2C9M3_9GAMM|nr:RNA polymerase-associated protein RapA [Coralloluteibacterium stylophorae]MBS7456204.1 RNA polymerase-associated protein RapA [Coralloluteibacterium stylophorae]